MKIVYGERIGKEGKILVGCSAVIFDETRQKVLLTRRVDNHQWCLPGGHMEPGETVTEACIREVWEETGLNVEVKRLAGVYSNPNRYIQYADGNKFHSVALNFEVVVVDGKLATSNETTEFGYFSLPEIYKLDIVPHHVERIEDIFKEPPKMFLR